MKKKIVSLLQALCMIISVSGCSKSAETKKAEVPETESVEMEKVEIAEKEYFSKIKAEECYICGENERSLIPYYSKKDSIGIIHWNSPAVSDTEVRAFDDDGNELFETGSMSTRVNSFGDGYGNVMIQGMPDRGLAEVTAHFSDADTVDMEKLRDILCQNCLDKVAEFYNEQMENGEEKYMGATGFALIDFQTKELYRLCDPYREYMIRDYIVRYDMHEKEDGAYIDVTICYAPKRTEN